MSDNFDVRFQIKFIDEEEIGVLDNFTSDVIVLRNIDKGLNFKEVYNYTYGIVQLMNALDIELVNTAKVLSDFMSMLNKFQKFFKLGYVYEDFTEEDFKELIKLGNMSRDMLHMMDYDFSNE